MDLGAKKSAAGAQVFLENSLIFKSWNDYLEEHSNCFRCAFSARSGKNRKCYIWEDWLLEQKLPANIHLVFGAEDSGLSDEDLLHCQILAQLSTFGDFKSLNLAQAALIAMYVLQNTWKTQIADSPTIQAPHYFLEGPILKEWLLSIGFLLDSPKVNAFTRLQKYFNRSPLEKEEYETLVKVLNQSKRKLKSHK